MPNNQRPQRLAVPRLIAASALVTTATAVRTGTRWADLMLRRTPAIARHAVDALSDATSAAGLRDELIALFRETAELTWRELRRGVDDLDSVTRSEDATPEAARRYRAKP